MGDFVTFASVTFTDTCTSDTLWAIYSASHTSQAYINTSGMEHYLNKIKIDISGYLTVFSQSAILSFVLI